MLDDRDYMRQPEYHDSGWRPRFHLRWSWTVILLIAYAVVFLAELAAQQFFPNNHFFHADEAFINGVATYFPGYMPLSLEGIEHGYLWQLVTYQFMHAGFWHIFLNSWVIYFFGRELEEILGGKKFLVLMFSSGIVGGIFQVLVAWVWPQYFGTHIEHGQIIGGAVVGASACGFGLIAAFAAMFPTRELTLLLLFVIPVTLRARTLLIGFAVVAVAGFSFPNIIMPHVAHAAHIGGMVMGWFFVRKILQGDWTRLAGTLRPVEKEKTVPPGLRPLETADDEDFVESKVDPILDKISAHGIQSLTSREREILENARKQIRRP